ncbi:hypothetical protein HY572_04560 [Candidatus Micrarchaeota archaeon]|nr:hypothetical protein [Candidatus Micrarchaeota archaeon]
MNVLVVYDGSKAKQLAEAIAQGARKINSRVVVKTSLETPSISGFDFVFAGGLLHHGFSIQKYLESQNLSKTKMALFCVKKGTGNFGLAVKSILFDLTDQDRRIRNEPGNLDFVVKNLRQKGAQLDKTVFYAQLQGTFSVFGFGNLSDSDSIRARAFSERVMNVTFNLKNSQE